MNWVGSEENIPCRHGAIAVTAEKSAEIVDGLVKRVRLRWNRERS